MARNKYRPDYGELYPGTDIPAKVLAELKKSDRKMEYMEYDLKTEQPIKDEDGVVIGLMPAREDSFERLLEKNVQFISDAPGPEELTEAREEADELHRCLALLDKDERALIDALFFEGLSERKYGARIGLSQKNVNKRKRRVLEKIKKLFTF